MNKKINFDRFKINREKSSNLTHSLAKSFRSSLSLYMQIKSKMNPSLDRCAERRQKRQFQFTVGNFGWQWEFAVGGGRHDMGGGGMILGWAVCGGGVMWGSGDDVGEGGLWGKGGFVEEKDDVGGGRKYLARLL